MRYQFSLVVICRVSTIAIPGELDRSGSVCSVWFYSYYYCVLMTGTIATIASASDLDAGENAEITYSIAYPNEDGSSGSSLPFDIDPFTGEVGHSPVVL